MASFIVATQPWPVNQIVGVDEAAAAADAMPYILQLWLQQMKAKPEQLCVCTGLTLDLCCGTTK